MSRAGTVIRTNGVRVVVAHSFLRRLRGLLGRRSMAPDEALLLAPCPSVHTFWMRFAIDVVFLDVAGEVMRVVPGLGPWRFAWARGAHACLELPAGGAARAGLHAGVRLAQLAADSGWIR
jgi:uncharacterized membrane protein (UPF0127 family)